MNIVLANGPGPARRAGISAASKPCKTNFRPASREADDVLLELEREFYEPGFPALKAVILKDLLRPERKSRGSLPRRRQRHLPRASEELLNRYGTCSSSSPSSSSRLLFTYTNGFHDTANAIATVVGTKVLTPRQAIVLAAVTNLIGAFFGLAVAKTISSGSGGCRASSRSRC